MPHQTFYVPVNADTLVHYFSRALLLPSSFYENKPVDFQSKSKTSLLLSRGSKWVEDSDCSLEIILTEAESENALAVDANFQLFSYAGAIPLSRVSAVYFCEIRRSELTQWNINNGDAFLPNRLIRVEQKTNIYNHPTELPEANRLPADFADKMVTFDRLLGAVAFMNTAKSARSSFAIDYFSVVSYFNSFIKAQFKDAVKAGLATFDERLQGIFKREDEAWRDVRPFITEGASVDDVEKLAERHNVPVEQKYGLIELAPLASHRILYLTALLAMYGPEKPKGISDLVTEIISQESDEKKAEQIALLFGSRFRYSRLRNKYAAKSMVETKFALESQLDYYIIESVFQVATAGRTAASLDYIDRIAPRTVKPSSVGPNSYMILDVLVSPKQATVAQAVSLGPATRQPPAKTSAPDGSQKTLSGLGDRVSALVQEEVRKLLQAEERASQVQMRELREEVNQLKQQLAKKSSTPVRDNSVPPAAPASTGELRRSDLWTKEMKELKVIAKDCKIDKKILTAIKPNKEGFDKIITLIEAQRRLEL